MVEKEPQDKVTAEDIDVLLSQKYCEPAWAYFPEVRNGTGFISSVRTADAIAMSLWPSRGLDIHGFEIKVYRSDWIKELKTPKKAEEIAQFCDFWWIVTTKELGKLIIDKGELPSTWGLMIKRGKGLYQLRQAKKLDSIEPDRLFLASLLRKIYEHKTSDAIIKKAKRESYNKGYKDGEAQDNDKNHLKEIEEALKVFEEKSGVKINMYETKESAALIGEGLKAVLRGEHRHILNQLEKLPDKVRNIEHYLKHTICDIKGEKCCDEKKPYIGFS